MIKIEYSQKAYKFIKKANKNLSLKIKQSIEEIANNPEGSELLTGSLSGIYSYHFSFLSTAYRIAYMYDTKKISILLIGNRENFYKELGRTI